MRQLNKEQELGLAQNRKKFDIREEYFVSSIPRILLYITQQLLSEIELVRSKRLGAEAHPATSRSSRMGRTTTRTACRFQEVPVTPSPVLSVLLNSMLIRLRTASHKPYPHPRIMLYF